MPDVQPFLQPSAQLSSPDPSVTADMTDLIDRLKAASPKNQLQLVQEAANAGETELDALMKYLLEQQPKLTDFGALANSGGGAAANTAGTVEGKIYQILMQSESPKVREFLQTHFAQGLLSLPSERGIDYSQLQTLLAEQQFEAADRLTLEKLCELAGPLAVQRKWLYFTEVEKFPITDLKTIDTLWRVYSEGKFGYSVQREIWLGVSKNWEKLWFQIGWKNGNSWTRYPQEFTWNLSAPRGHLPLSNQLRGVRVIAALLAHPAWTN
ncbi:GUN4 domain-containing protein [Leptolyngbya ohadii]|uniref:GUN4 domain-containing protein n=1 Tax=Leptolyngbya ohadii TaxID=1962290 RepID=UPI000B5A1795|nr:GUN4 domain-containing protein [Leptolyngbya ohadii]